MKVRFALSMVAGAAALLTATASNASLIYDTWTSNDAANGNYIVTVDHNALLNQFDINFTVDPWNAEGLGLFIDLGDFDIPGGVGLANSSPGGQVSLYATDTSSNRCGQGCNLNGLNPTLPGDGEWELVFRLASQGYDGIQSFSFSINDFGLTESAFGLIGVRAQQLCGPGETLPSANCGGSDKSYGSPGGTDPNPRQVPVPGTLALLGFGLLGLGWSRQRSAA